MGERGYGWGESAAPLRGCFSFAQPGEAAGSTGARRAHARAQTANVVKGRRLGHSRERLLRAGYVEAAQRRAARGDSWHAGRWPS